MCYTEYVLHSEYVVVIHHKAAAHARQRGGLDGQTFTLESRQVFGWWCQLQVRQPV